MTGRQRVYNQIKCIIVLLVTYLEEGHALPEDVGAAELMGIVVGGAPVVLVFTTVSLLEAYFWLSHPLCEVTDLLC